MAYQDYLVVATAGGDVSLWDFPQFLATVEKVSQDYHLEGLQPLSVWTVKGRILCMEIKELGLA